MSSYDDPSIKILVSGFDDWVSLAEARSLVQVAHADLDARTLRAETLDVVGRLLSLDALRPGTLSDRFTPWEGDPSEFLERIAAGWNDTDADGWLYSVWFENTKAGSELARSSLR